MAVNTHTAFPRAIRKETRASLVRGVRTIARGMTEIRTIREQGRPA